MAGRDKTAGGAGAAGVLTFQPELAMVQSGQSLNVEIDARADRGQRPANRNPSRNARTVQPAEQLRWSSTINWNLGSLVTVNGGTLQISNDTTFSSGSDTELGGGTIIFVLAERWRSTVARRSYYRHRAGRWRDPPNQRRRIIQREPTTSISPIPTPVGSTGTLIVDGAGLRFATTSTYSDWGRSPGNSATITFDHGGVGTYSGGLVVAGGGGTALVNLLGAAQLNVATRVSRAPARCARRRRRSSPPSRRACCRPRTGRRRGPAAPAASPDAARPGRSGRSGPRPILRPV